MTLNDQITDYIRKRETDKLEKHDKTATKALEKTAVKESDLSLSKKKLDEKRQIISDAHDPPIWLDDAAKRARQISLVTHGAKFTHGDSGSSSVVANCSPALPELIGTHTLSKHTIDVVGNAAALDVANLLLLGNESDPLWKQIQANDDKALRAFSDDPERVANWIDGFKQAVAVKEFQSHTLAKQTYFPVGGDEYHLLSPLFPTSLMHELYEQVHDTRFSDMAKKTREQRRNEKGATDDAVYYPALVRLNFGGSKPQNVSLLNSRRGGKAYLLSCAPPNWTEQLRLPLKGETAFWRLYSRNVRRDVRNLRNYLGRVEDFNNKNVREGRARRVTGLVDSLLQLVARIRQLGNPGWSAKADLPLAEQCLLDPKRYQLDLNDNAFDQLFDRKEWIDTVADHYGQWLNRQLGQIRTAKGVMLRDLGDAEAGMWKRELANEIALLRNNLEHML